MATKQKTSNGRADGKDDGYGRFDFMGTVKIWGSISAVAILGSLILFATKGFNYGIDFAGGTEVQVKFQQPTESSHVREFLNTINLGDSHLQSLGDKNEFLVRFDNRSVPKDEKGNLNLAGVIKSITDGLSTKFGGDNVSVERVDSVGPQVGDQLKRNAILALFYGLLAILIYTALRFDYNYAPGAVLCLFHDAIATMGVLVLLNKEVSVQTLAAILTIIGYSINDTIVIYDRIREDLHHYKEKPLPWVINQAINKMLSRTFITSFLTFLSCVGLYVWGKGVIQEFAFVMGLGIIFGTYSTVYIASPMIILFDRFKTQR